MNEQVSLGDVLADAPVVYTPRLPKLKVTKHPERVAGQPPIAGMIVTSDESSELIMGWRVWRPGPEVGEGKTLLGVFKPSEWTIRDMVGKCMKRKWKENDIRLCTEHLSKLEVRTSSHERHGANYCSCGLHTVKHVNDLPESYRRSQGGTGYIVLGACVVFGTVVETRRGYLSDRARIEALYVCPDRDVQLKNADGEVTSEIRYFITEAMELAAEKYRRQFGVPVRVCRQEEIE